MREEKKGEALPSPLSSFPVPLPSAPILSAHYDLIFELTVLKKMAIVHSFTGADQGNSERQGCMGLGQFRQKPLYWHVENL
jgi:hypothetical protein